MKILITGDKILTKKIRRFLETEGFYCRVAHTGKTALEMIKLQIFDLLLIDLKLPDADGLEFMKEALTARKSMAVILISQGNSSEERVEGLNRGADDYLSKPLSLKELKSRILAVMRRKHGIPSNIIQSGDLKLNLDNREVVYSENPIKLTRREYDILCYMMMNKNRVLSRIQISENIWGDAIDEDYKSNFLDVHMKNLRKKLSSHLRGEILETIRGIGFRFNETIM